MYVFFVYISCLGVLKHYVIISIHQTNSTNQMNTQLNEPNTLTKSNKMINCVGVYITQLHAIIHITAIQHNTNEHC